jgi:hypothetical protein
VAFFLFFILALRQAQCDVGKSEELKVENCTNLGIDFKILIFPAGIYFELKVMNEKYEQSKRITESL